MFLSSFVKKLFGSKNDRELKKLLPLVGRINAMEEEMRALSDAQLAAKTPAFRQRLDNGEPLR
ncbi:MAG: hypothetical protein II967_00205, partial [Deltaproteobacteria bacterium]|nr:hypothetical protein [Deltaproteobacteria bacterium]